jgi:protease I
MQDAELKGKSVAILVTDGFEQVELTGPRDALDQAGAAVFIVAPTKTKEDGRVKGWNLTGWGDQVTVDVRLEEADAARFDALVLPGGVMNPDKLRIMPEARAFVRKFLDANKPVAAICHGPWTLIDAGGARGRKMTSWPTLRTDLENAGAIWSDREVVVDGMLVTSRKPDDLPAFCRELIALIKRGSVARAKHPSGRATHASTSARHSGAAR